MGERDVALPGLGHRFLPAAGVQGGGPEPGKASENGEGRCRRFCCDMSSIVVESSS